ncbi:hypothetical protein ACH4UV_16340 [Streptomyces sp. NPDC020802]|uniref:hypothetical protein n=1 Tax=Streptomyces sp. NPDC020802 TaxID=3365094 RepID=UPI00379DB75F
MAEAVTVRGGKASKATIRRLFRGETFSEQSATAVAWMLATSDVRSARGPRSEGDWDAFDSQLFDLLRRAQQAAEQIGVPTPASGLSGDEIFMILSAPPTWPKINASAHTIIGSDSNSSYADNREYLDLRHWMTPHQSMHHTIHHGGGYIPCLDRHQENHLDLLVVVFEEGIIGARGSHFAPRVREDHENWSLAHSIPSFTSGVIMIAGFRGNVKAATANEQWRQETEEVLVISSEGSAEDLIGDLHYTINLTGIRGEFSGARLMAEAAKIVQEGNQDPTLFGYSHQLHMASP